jgi:hypothetical protein
LAGLAIVLTIPALGIGWQLDDHFLRLVMTESPNIEFTPMEGFSTLKDPATNRRFRNLGILPWWTPDGFRLAFFRPLSLATMRLDYLLWPDSALLMHAHSLLWYAALVAAAAFLYRRLIQSAWVAGLAGLLYAIDEAHAGPAAWLANRNALCAALFGVLCLIAHDGWRRYGWKPGLWIAPALLALGLAAGEVALATAGYLFAYAVCLDSRKARAKSLLGYVAVLAMWAVLYQVNGYGASGSGLYIDPLQSPVVFAKALVERAPFLLLGQWTPVPAEVGAFVPPSARLFWWGLAALSLVLILAALAPQLRRDSTARFWGLGMLLSLLPISAPFPSNRLLLFVGLGAMGLLARFIETNLFRIGDAPIRQSFASLPSRGLAWFFVAAHLILAPLLLPIAPLTIRETGETMHVAATSLGRDPQMAEQDLIVANTPDYLFFVANLPTMQTLAARPVPRRVRALSVGPSNVTLSRIDEYTLRVDLEEGLFTGPLSRLFRDAASPLPTGHKVQLDDLRIEVLDSPGGDSPTALLYRFSSPLEDPSLRWVSWSDGRYVPLAPPRVGETISLPPAIGPFDGLLTRPGEGQS